MDLTNLLYARVRNLEEYIETSRHTFPEQDAILLHRLLKSAPLEVHNLVNERITNAPDFSTHAWTQKEMLTLLLKEHLKTTESKLSFAEFALKDGAKDFDVERQKVAALEKEVEFLRHEVRETEKLRKRTRTLEEDLIGAVRARQSVEERLKRVTLDMADETGVRLKRARTEAMDEINEQWVILCGLVQKEGVPVTDSMVEALDAIRTAVAKKLV